MTKSDLQFWREYSELYVKVLLEEDRLGLHGAEAQRRVTKNKKDSL
jgi:hypothetical protein